jgi:plasmid maintenance system antidote protein VapI
MEAQPASRQHNPMKTMTPEKILDYLQRIRSVPTLTEVGSTVGVHRQHLEQIIKRKRSITPAMAYRLSTSLHEVKRQLRETFAV